MNANINDFSKEEDCIDNPAEKTTIDSTNYLSNKTQKNSPSIKNPFSIKDPPIPKKISPVPKKTFLINRLFPKEPEVIIINSNHENDNKDDLSFHLHLQKKRQPK